MIGFGEKNEEFGKLPPYLVSCEEIIDNDKPNNSLRIKIETDTGLGIEIEFQGYMMYLMRNESYTVYDDYEVRKGHYLITFEKSRLLDFYDTVIFHIEDYSYPKHFGIYTCDHIIDVIAESQPIITKL